MMPPAEARPRAGTVLTTETPLSSDGPDGFEYPFPDRGEPALYQRYRTRAESPAPMW